MNDTSVDQLLRTVESELPQPFKEWPGGWPDEIEAALLDAVLSIRANYGQSHNGVRGAVRRYRAHQTGPLNSLKRLASYESEQLESLLGVAQRTSGRSKAGAIIEAARALSDEGVEGAKDLDADDKTHKRAYVGVHGLGPITWEYFTMLLGKPGVKADVWIVRWVSAAIGRQADPLSPAAARQVLHRAHSQIEADAPGDTPSLTQLDHAIWSHARRTKR